MARATFPSIPATNKLLEGVAGDVVRDLAVGPLAPCRLTIAEEDIRRWISIHDDRYPWYADADARARGESSAPPYILYYASQNLLRPIRHFAGRPGEGVVLNNLTGDDSPATRRNSSHRSRSGVRSRSQAPSSTSFVGGRPSA